MTNTPLHALNPIGRFDDRASDYVKYRPSYPTEAIDLILEGLGEPGALAAADVARARAFPHACSPTAACA